MPDDLRLWIERFNKRKGWQTIPIPDSNDNAINTPRFEMKRREALSEQEISSVTSDLIKTRSVVIDLSEKLKVAQETRGGEPAKIELLLESAKLQESKVEARLEEAEQRLRRRQMATEQADQLDEGMKDAIRKEFKVIEKLEMAVMQKAKKSKKKAPDQDLVDYRKTRDEAIEAIDKVRGEVIQLHALDGFESQVYNGINGAEYTLLMTQLRKADLIADLGEFEKARSQVRNTLDELDRINKIRKGLIPIRQENRDHPELEEVEQRAKTFARAIRDRGFTVLADDLDRKTRKLIKEYVELRGQTPQEELANLATPMRAHAETCETDFGKVNKFGKTGEAFFKIVGELRALGFDRRADDYDKIWNSRKPGTDVDDDLKWAAGVLGDLQDTFERRRKRALRHENIDPVALGQQLAKIRQDYEGMFKHDRDGNRKTIKDSQTRDDKGVKKDSRIPREALDEIQMKLMVADMLLQSNSVEAMKQASDYLDSIAEFQTNVSEDSKRYETAKSGLGKVRDRLSQMDKRYNSYKGAERLSLKLDADSFEERYKGQSPDMNLEQAGDLVRRGNELKAEVQSLKSRHEQFTKSAKKLSKRLDELGTLFKSNDYSRGGVDVTGYYGDLRKKLGEAQTKADQFDDDGLRDAMQMLVDTESTFDRWREVVKKRFDVGPDKLRGDDLDDWYEIRSDAVSGQKSKNEEVELGTTFKERHPVILGRAKKAAEDFESLKLDPTDAKMAVLEIETLAKQMKSKPDFSRGLSDLDRHEKAIEAVEQTVKDIEGFKAKPIGEAAVQTVAQVNAFLDFANGFDTIVKNVPDLGPKDPPDNDPVDVDAAQLRKFLDLVADAVPQGVLTDLVDHAKAFGRQKLLTQEARGQREKALIALRQIVGHLESSAPVIQFRKQTFVPDSTLTTALSALSRLEVKLLTTLKS
jgi:hypothetical protein